MVWLARAQAHTVYLCMRFVAGICDFFVDSFENCPMLSSLSARACGGKVGAGTVEAEEDICMGGVDLFSLLRGQTISCRYLDRQGGKESYGVCAVFSSWLKGCMDRFCRADYLLSGGEMEDDSGYSGLSLDILYSMGGSGLLDRLAGWLAGWLIGFVARLAMVLRQKLQMRG